MQIKTTEGDREVASKGVAGTALGLGIAGTVGLLNQLSGAGWGGGFLGNRGVCPTAAAVGLTDAVATTDTREISKLESKIARLDKSVAVNNQATTDNFAFLNNKIDETKKEVLCYCNATFVPGKLVMPLSSICPEAMQRYNSWTAPTGTAPAGA